MAGRGWTPAATTHASAVTTGPKVTQPVAVVVPGGLSMNPVTRVLSVNLSAAGSSARVSGPMIIVTGEDADLIIGTNGVTTMAGNASGVVQSIMVEGHPLRLDGTVGHMVCSYRASLESLPGTDAQIWAVFSEKPDNSQEFSFEQAVAAENSLIDGIAGVMVVRMESMPSIGPATIWMSAPAIWVNEHGGTSSISILRSGDNGEMEVLETTFSGYGEEGTMVFEGASPRGLSTFGLAAVAPAEPGRIPAILAAPQVAKTAAPVVGSADVRPDETGGSSLPLGIAMTAMSSILLVSSVILGIYLVRFGRVLGPKR